MLKKVFSMAVLSVGLLAMAMAGPSARPAVAAPSSAPINVNSTVDWPDDSPGDGFCHTAPTSPAAGACTLRAAVMEADKASGAGVTIIVPAGIYSLTIPADLTDTANTGDLNLTAPASGNPLISIVGAGAASTIIDANQIDRVLSVDVVSRTASVSGVTLRGGYVVGARGGGILNYGTLTVDNSTITGNQVVNDGGGGIFNNGTLTVTNSTIGPNNTAGVGGGIYTLHTLTVDRSTVYGNSANNGGGIFNDLRDLTLINSTVSQNSAVTGGGGLYNTGTANAYNTTIVFNRADTGSTTSSSAGGVKSDASGIFNLRNTLLAGNYASSAFAAAECTGTVYSFGQNVFGEADLSPCTVVNLAGGSWYVLNLIGTLGQLQDNGGPTWTHALLTGSNAIDGGDPVGGCVDGNLVPLATDQRGIPRVVGASCDVGAFEYLPPVLYLPLVRSATGIQATFSMEKTSGVIYEDMFFDFNVVNNMASAITFGILAAHTDQGVTADSWHDPLLPGKVLSWKDHINFPNSGTYQVYLGICYASHDACKTGGAPWTRLSDSIAVTIQ